MYRYIDLSLISHCTLALRLRFPDPMEMISPMVLFAGEILFTCLLLFILFIIEVMVVCGHCGGSQGFRVSVRGF